MPNAREVKGERRTSRILIASTPGQASDRIAETTRRRRKKDEQATPTPKGLTTDVYAQIWILATLRAADAPMWGRKIIDEIQEATKVSTAESTVYPGYTLAHGYVYDILKRFSADGYIEEAPLEAGSEPHTGGLQSPKAYRITPAGRKYLTQLSEEYRAEIAGALRTIQTFVSKVYDVDVLTAPLTRLRYTDRQGDPNKIV